jgi:hypothetical protein
MRQVWTRLQWINKLLLLDVSTCRSNQRNVFNATAMGTAMVVTWPVKAYMPQVCCSSIALLYTLY